MKNKKSFAIKSSGAIIVMLSLVLFASACNHGSTVSSNPTTNPNPQTTQASPDSKATPTTSNSSSNDTTDSKNPTTTKEAPKEDIDVFPLLLNAKQAIATAWHKNLGMQRFLIAERHGFVWMLTYDTSGRVTDETIVLDISEDTIAQSEQGFLGMTFSPDGKWLYISYSDTKADRAGGATFPNVVQAVKATDLGTRNAKSIPRTTIITIPQPGGNHNGGDIAFSPKDEHLYVALGDGGGANDQFRNGQNLETLNGSILRISPTPETGGYEIPADNPFVDRSDARSEIWAYGIRNAWRISFNKETGDLWIGDVGQNEIEEIDVIPNGVGGLNLGWNEYEGSKPFRGPPPNLEAHHLPIFEYEHSVAEGTESRRCSVTGGFIYSGDLIPALIGKYIYADFCAAGVIWAIDPNDASPSISANGKIPKGGDTLILNQNSIGSIINFGETPTGEIIVGTLSGTFILLPATNP